MPTSIDGTSVTGITIDGDNVVEVTMDGDVVWTGEIDFYIYGGDENGNVAKVDRDAVEQWNVAVGSGQTYSLTASSDGNYLYAGIYDDIYELNTSDGSESWSTSLYNSSIGTTNNVWANDLNPSDTYVYTMTYDGQVRKIDVADGSVVWSLEQHPNYGGQALSVGPNGDYIYSGDDYYNGNGGDIAKADSSGNNIWTINHGSTDVNALETDSTYIYVGDGANEVHRYDFSGNHDSGWGPIILSTHIDDISLGPDKNYIYIIRDEPEVLKYDIGAVSQQWSHSYATTGVATWSVTAGMNGDYVYHDAGDSEIEAITSAGSGSTFGYTMSSQLTATEVGR